MSEPNADMRAYCATEILKSLIGTKPDTQITEEDLAESQWGKYVITSHGVIKQHGGHYGGQECKCTRYNIATTKEQRLGRIAVKMADGLLWALEHTPHPKQKDTN